MVYSFQGNNKLYAKYMNAIFGDQLYRRYILKMSTNLSRLLVLRFCFSEFFQDGIPVGHLYGITYQGHVLRINKRAEAVVHLNDRVNGPLNLKENTPEYAFS